jgi:hypothetical protein
MDKTSSSAVAVAMETCFDAAVLKKLLLEAYRHRARAWYSSSSFPPPLSFLSKHIYLHDLPTRES